MQVRPADAAAKRFHKDLAGGGLDLCDIVINELAAAPHHRTHDFPPWFLT
jgi:hypothetical protein